MASSFRNTFYRCHKACAKDENNTNETVKKSYGQKKFEALKKVCCLKSETLKSAGKKKSKFGSFSAAILFQFPYGKMALPSTMDLKPFLVLERFLQDEKAGNKTEDAKKEKSDANKPSKPVTVREPLEMALHWVDVSDTSDDVLSASVKK